MLIGCCAPAPTAVAAARTRVNLVRFLIWATPLWELHEESRLQIVGKVGDQRNLCRGFSYAAPGLHLRSAHEDRFMRPHRALLYLTAQRVALIGVSALLLACDPLAAFEPQIIDETELFALQAKDVTNITATAKFDWTTTQTQVTVHHATTTTSAGSASIRILDAAGTLVYSHALLPELSQPTTKGVPGSWTIEVTMTGFSGTVGFHILAGVP